jgi:CheY-like chemotaxis protein
MDDLSSLSVLVIDDSYVNRQLMKTILDDEFKEVIEAGDGTEALEILESGTKPDLVILDLMMPVMDGIETLKRIRKLGYAIPIIVITADIEDANRTKCIELGVSGFINKPIYGTQVVRLINGVLINKNNSL